MERSPIESREISSVGYDPDSALLEVEFKQGSIYVIQDVPKRVYENLVTARSPGTYYHRHIRRADFPRRRI